MNATDAPSIGYRLAIWSLRPRGQPTPPTVTIGLYGPAPGVGGVYALVGMLPLTEQVSFKDIGRFSSLAAAKEWVVTEHPPDLFELIELSPQGLAEVQRYIAEVTAESHA